MEDLHFPGSPEVSALLERESNPLYTHDATQESKQPKSQAANVIAALRYYFVSPSKKYPIVSAVLPSVRMEHLEELCPGVCEKIADLYLRCGLSSRKPKSDPSLTEDVVRSRTAKSLRLPMLAFLLQRWIFVVVNTWIPGKKFDEWMCRRDEPEKRTETLVSPFFTDCEMWLASLPGSEREFHSLINPFGSHGVQGLTRQILKQERANLAAANVKHFLLESWLITHEALCSCAAAKSSAAASDAALLLKAAVKAARQKVDAVYQFLEAPVFQCKSSHTKAVSDIYSSHRDAIYNASPFDLCGTAVFVSLKEKCEEAFSHHAFTRTQEKKVSGILSRFHADCLTYFNYMECTQARVIPILDAFMYFLSMSSPTCAQKQSRASSVVSPTMNKKNRSQSRVSFLEVSLQTASLAVSDTIGLRSCVTACFQSGEALQKFRTSTRDILLSTGEKNVTDVLNSSREDVTGLDDYSKTIEVRLPTLPGDEDINIHIRTEEEQKVYRELRAILYSPDSGSAETLVPWGR